MKTTHFMTLFTALVFVSSCKTHLDGGQVTTTYKPPRISASLPPPAGYYPRMPEKSDQGEPNADWNAIIQKHWEDYLQAIQEDEDYPNWSQRPYDYIRLNAITPANE